MKGLKGSKTEINLYKSFAEACRAMGKYKMYSKRAKKDKYNCIAHMFGEMESCEYQYIKRMYEGFLCNIGDTEDNLKMAMMCSCNDMYKECEKTAREEGFDEIADFYKELHKVMKKHHRELEEIHKKIVDGTMYESEMDVNWSCTKCCYMVTSKSAPMKCPMCGSHQGYFKMDKYKNYDMMQENMEDNDLKCMFKIYMNQKTMKCVHNCMVNCIEKCICYLKKNDVSKNTIYSIYKDCMDKCMELMEELKMDLAKSYDMQDMTHEELKKHLIDCAMKCMDKMMKYMEKSARKHINRKDEDEVIDGLREVCEKEKNLLHDQMMEFHMKNCYDMFMKEKDNYKMYIGMDKEEIKKICEKKLEMMNMYMDNLNELGKELMEMCMDIIDDMDAKDENMDEIKEYMMQKCMKLNKKMHCYAMDMYEENTTLEKCKEKFIKNYKKCMEGMKEMYMDMVNNYIKDYDLMEMKEKCDKAYDKYMNKMMKM